VPGHPMQSIIRRIRTAPIALLQETARPGAA
jgi:hypothetical protein